MRVRKGLIVSGGVTIVLAILAITGVIGFNTLLLPVNAGATVEEILVEIPPGASTREIASRLKENEIIRNALFFRLYAQWAGQDQEFLAGTYRLNPAMGMREIMDTIIRGAVYRDTIWLVIPEGSTVEQIAAELQREELLDRSQFLELCTAPSPLLLERFYFLQEAVLHSGMHYVLEGYLFPDTYEIERGADAEEIALLMLHRLETVLSRERVDRAAELGLDVHQLLTLASIVEREAVVDRERRRIASVFHNRLQRDYPLQSCATVQYLLSEAKENLTLDDLALESPYNTYLYPGLPPGPIAVPGEQSLLAALSPEETGYFYFNAKDDGSGEHYFSRTLEEHYYHIGLSQQK